MKGEFKELAVEALTDGEGLIETEELGEVEVAGSGAAPDALSEAEIAMADGLGRDGGIELNAGLGKTGTRRVASCCPGI
jgi:hypothetical protein